MNETRVLVVYESMFGNTEQVARGIASGLSAHCAVEMVDVDTAPSAAEPAVALLVVGGPTHAFSMSRVATREDAHRQGARQGSSARGIREWLQAARLAPGQPIALFDTRVAKVRRLPGSAARAALRVARRRGLEPLDGPRSFYVDDVKGPLSDGELAAATSWGDALGTLLDQERPARSAP